MTQLSQWNNRDDYGYPTRPASRRLLRNIVVHTSKRLLLAGVYGGMSIVGAFLNARRTPEQSRPRVPQHILLIRVDLIGDLTMSLTILRPLRRAYPDAKIDLLSTPSSATIASADPDLASIITYDPNIWRRPKALLQRKNWQDALALRRRLQARHYDLAISVSGPWAAILAVVSGAQRRIGFGKESYPGFMTDTVPGRHWDPDDHKHEVDYCLELAHAAGATIEPDDRIPKLFVDPQASQQVGQLLQQEGWQPDRPLIACHVSSNNGQSKRWPIPYWATLMDRLIREDAANVVITGATADLPLIEQITSRMHERPIIMADKTSLPQLAALMQKANLLITGDSGPMHIGAAVGTPLIAIHGPTDPALSGPVSPEATTLRSDIWCSPCYNAKGPADCRFFTTQCMKDITPNQVFTVIHEKLQDNGTYTSSR